MKNFNFSINNRHATATRFAIWQDYWNIDRNTYPNGYRGDAGMLVRVRDREFRVQWCYASRLNDASHDDYARRINISPRFARWFSVIGYGGGKRIIIHLQIGHLWFSTVPTTF